MKPPCSDHRQCGEAALALGDSAAASEAFLRCLDCRPGDTELRACFDEVGAVGGAVDAIAQLSLYFGSVPMPVPVCFALLFLFFPFLFFALLRFAFICTYAHFLNGITNQQPTLFGMLVH